MKIRDKVILETKAWAEEMRQLDKELFSRLSQMHQPNILWVCSADSLVPIREVTNTDPGEILVHRNVANQVKPNDTNLMAVLEDALALSPLELVVVCGYSHCGGIRDVLQGCNDRVYVNDWLSDLRNLYERHKDELDRLPFEQKEKQLSLLNIKQQVQNLANLQMIKNSWREKKCPQLLGWYLDLPSGSFEEIVRIDPPEAS